MRLSIRLMADEARKRTLAVQQGQASEYGNLDSLERFCEEIIEPAHRDRYLVAKHLPRWSRTPLADDPTLCELLAEYRLLDSWLVFIRIVVQMERLLRQRDSDRSRRWGGPPSPPIEPA